MFTSNPIFALATSIQTSALHLHRLSGIGVIEALLPFLKYKKQFTFPDNARFPFTQYLKVYNQSDELIDDAVITFYKAPYSYTGEDLVEISCHGNPIISKNLQSFFRSLGFRDAREGEFTQRAFLNGKLDLAQAEAIRELIHAETSAGVKLSRNQLEGALTSEIRNLRQKFIEILTYLEAHIDFAPDEVGTYDPVHLLPLLEKILDRLHTLKCSYQSGLKLKSGLKLVLCGRPNAGKSTLYNKLLKSDRAIVTEIAGTTRDVLSERLQLENRDFVLMDTAGLRSTKNTVERIGVDKSMQTLNDADIICIIIDGSKSLATEASHIKKHVNEFFSNPNTVLVISKCDLLEVSKIEKIKTYVSKHFSNLPHLFISQDNISDLTSWLIQQYDQMHLNSFALQKDAPVLLSSRSYDKIQNAIILLLDTKNLIDAKDLPEKIASNLYVSLKTLEEILGEFDIDSVYQSIFSTFCIGK